MKKIGVFFVFIFFWPILALAENQLFISQVQITGGTGKTAEDFIELFNPSDVPTNLNGYRLVKRTENGTSDTSIKSWTTDTYIPARSFYLWANSNFLNINSTPDITTSGTLSDNNGIALRFGENDVGTILDSVSWGNANNGFLNLSTENPSANNALFRQDLYQSSSNFIIASSSPRNSSVQESLPPLATTTPELSASSTPNTSSSTPEYLSQSSYVKIYRFLPNPSGTDAGKEWVELQNLDEKDVLLDGWQIDDINTGSVPGSDALVLSGIIKVGEILRFVLPTDTFSLNNTGGDEVNLYWSDLSLVEKASYTVTAYDDGVFEYREGQWQPPVQVQSSGSSSGGSGTYNTSSGASNIQTIQFKFNEIFPDPLGDDAGKEWVEIYNPENSTSSLEGYFLADGTSDLWSSSAWTFPKNTFVPGKGLLAILIPKTAFALNNSGLEKVKLFSPQKDLVDSVIFKDAEQSRSWAKNMDGIWEWSLPTYGLDNNTVLELPKIYISEILPAPAGDDIEFVEIYNFSTSTVNLGGIGLQIGNKNKVFEEKDKIEPNSYFVIWEDNLPSRLTNTGQVLKLFDSYNRLINELVYKKAVSGNSYSSANGKDFVWTIQSTAGMENIYVLGQTVEIGSNRINSDKSSTVKIATNISKSDLNKLFASNEELQNQVFALQESVDSLSNQLSIVSDREKSLQNRPEENSLNRRFIGLGFGVIILLLFIFLFFKYVKL